MEAIVRQGLVEMILAELQEREVGDRLPRPGGRGAILVPCTLQIA
jgi:hypothetical protein